MFPLSTLITQRFSYVKYVTSTFFPKQKVQNSSILQFKARIYVPVGYINHKAFFAG